MLSSVIVDTIDTAYEDFAQGQNLFAEVAKSNSYVVVKTTTDSLYEPNSNITDMRVANIQILIVGYSMEVMLDYAEGIVSTVQDMAYNGYTHSFKRGGTTETYTIKSVTPLLLPTPAYYNNNRIVSTNFEIKYFYSR